MTPSEPRVLSVDEVRAARERFDDFANEPTTATYVRELCRAGIALCESLAALRADAERREKESENAFAERSRLRIALFTVAEKCGESDAWDAECDAAFRAAVMPIHEADATRSAAPAPGGPA